MNDKVRITVSKEQARRLHAGIQLLIQNNDQDLIATRKTQRLV